MSTAQPNRQRRPYLEDGINALLDYHQIQRPKLPKNFP